MLIETMNLDVFLVCVFLSCLAALFFYDAMHFILKAFRNFLSKTHNLSKEETKSFDEIFQNKSEK